MYECQATGLLCFLRQEAVHRVREALPLSQRPDGASHIYGNPEGQQRHEYVADVQVETETFFY